MCSVWSNSTFMPSRNISINHFFALKMAPKVPFAEKMLKFIKNCIFSSIFHVSFRWIVKSKLFEIWKSCKWMSCWKLFEVFKNQHLGNINFVAFVAFVDSTFGLEKRHFCLKSMKISETQDIQNLSEMLLRAIGA